MGLRAFMNVLSSHGNKVRWDQAKRRCALCLLGVVFPFGHDTTPSLLMCPRHLRHIQPRLRRTIWTNCSNWQCRNRQKYSTIASSDMPRSRRISREICGTHGAEVFDACTLIFSGLKDRSILTAKPFRLPLLIAAFLQKWPNAPAEHWL